MDSWARAPNALNQLPAIDRCATARSGLTNDPGLSQGQPRPLNVSLPSIHGYKPPGSGNETEPITPMDPRSCTTAHEG